MDSDLTDDPEKNKKIKKIKSVCLNYTLLLFYTSMTSNNVAETGPDSEIERAAIGRETIGNEPIG